MSESYIQQLIMLETPRFGCHLMRNNSGALADATGRIVRYGLGNVSKAQNNRIKSSDLIGFKVVKITPEMVGKTVAVFTAIECKEEGFKLDLRDKRIHAQHNFINFINTNGGIAGFCDSVESFQKLITSY